MLGDTGGWTSRQAAEISKDHLLRDCSPVGLQAAGELGPASPAGLRIHVHNTACPILDDQILKGR